MNSTAIIGAGKFAFSFSSALHLAGLNVNCIISRGINHAAELAGIADANSFSANITDISLNSDLFFITVPDSDIEGVAGELSELDFVFKEKIFVHCSGALDSSVLNSLSARGASTASFHIMQTFPSRQIIDVSNCYTSIETQQDLSYEILFNLAKRLNLKPFRLEKEQKTAYHLAGVFACNFLTGNIFAASETFSDNINTFDMLEPIIMSTINNIRQNGAPQALSGPIDRGDIETVKKHIGIIKDKEMLLSYIAQSYLLLRTAERKYGELSVNHKKIKTLLDEYLNNSFK